MWMVRGQQWWQACAEHTTLHICACLFSACVCTQFSFSDAPAHAALSTAPAVACWLHDCPSMVACAVRCCDSSISVCQLRLRPAFGCGWGWLAGAGGVLWHGQVLVGTPALGGYTCLVTAVVGFERAPHCEVGVCVCACRGLLAAGLAVDWGSVVWVLLWTTASRWLCLLGHVQDHYFTLHLPQQVMVCSCPQFEHCWTSRKRLVGARLSVDSAHFSRSISSPGVHHSCRRRTTFRHHGM